jgi:hypothetical protein
MDTNPTKQRQQFYRDYASGQWSMSELCALSAIPTSVLRLTPAAGAPQLGQRTEISLMRVPETESTVSL